MLSLVKRNNFHSHARNAANFGVRYGSQLLEDATLALAVVVAWLVVATFALELPFPVCPSLTGVRQTPL